MFLKSSHTATIYPIGLHWPHDPDVALQAGDTVDFAVGRGNGSYAADSTGVEISIRSADGKSYDAAREFSVESNPNRVWSYGVFNPGASPDASTFRPYAEGKVAGDAESHGEAIGSISNPGSKVWEDVLGDQHPYQRAPHTAGIIRTLRTLSGGRNPVFMSEYGVGSSLDLATMTRPL